MPVTEAKPVQAGLLSGSNAVPLEGVSVEADVTEVYARVTITQRYRNTEPTAIEAVYVFPLDEGAAVCGFEAITGGIHYVAEVKPRDEAFRTYDDALQEGHGAFLLDEERPDVFTASVGNILPGAEVLLQTKYVAELALEGDALRFTLPTTVSPRYAPAEDRKGVGRNDAEVLNPPVAWKVPYGLDLSLRISMPGAITKVASPSHPIELSLAGSRATVTLAQGTTALDRDVTVLIEAEGVHTPHVRLERDEQGQLAAAFVMRPSFDTTEAPADIVFLVDRSGSMQGSSINEVRNALQLCLRSMTEGCRFNIIGFGSRHVSLFESSRPYDDASLAAASAHIAALDADLGGTEILPALQAVYAQPATPGLARQIVVLTDGDVTNTDAVLALIAAHAANVRVFSFGIGRGASAHLVRGMARAGRGTAEFIAPGDRIEAKVMRQFARLLSPSLTEVALHWPAGTSTAPAVLPPIFVNDRLMVYAFVKNAEAISAGVTLSAKSVDRSLSLHAPLAEGAPAEGRTLATLAARARIRELEEGAGSQARRGSRQSARTADADSSEVVRLATTYRLLSRETSFVVVEHREGAVAGEMQLRRIPVALRSGWGGLDETLGSGAFLAAPAPPMASAPDALSSMSAPADFKPLRSPGRVRGVKDFLYSKLTRLGRTLESDSDASPAAAAPTRTPGARRALDEVVALQRADGSWELTQDFARHLGVDLDELRRRQPTHAGAADADRVWATALALSWLEQHAAASQAEWAMLAAKAHRWLAARMGSAEVRSALAAAMRVVM